MKTIPTLAVISTERSGTNFLGACLRQLDGDAVFMELLADGAVYGMSRYPSIGRIMSALIDHEISGDHDTEFSRLMHEAPVKHISLLNHASAKEGRLFFSYKIFPEHLDIPRMMIALKKPDVTPLFLVRRRLDCFISYQKALTSGVWQDADTTEMRPVVHLAEFEEWARSRDRWYTRLYQKCLDADVAPIVMRYETDVDVPATDLVERLRHILHTAGVEADVKGCGLDAIGFKKQDKGNDPFDKIANGNDLRKELIERGRLDYACGWALNQQNAPKPDKKTKPNKKAGHAGNVPVVDGPSKWGVAHTSFFHWTVLDQPDLVTMTSVEGNCLHLPEIMFDAPELAGEGPGLHFLSPTWTIQQRSLDYIGRTLTQFHTRFPKHRAFLQAADAAELKTLQAAGIPSMLCNGSVYQDENQFVIAPKPYVELPQSDSLYLANFLPFKRHALCQSLDRPMFIYDLIANRNIEDSLTDQLLINSGSIFVNHALNGGTHRRLDPPELSRAARSAKTALCLSAVEGHMRASIQMLLCGLPVVSTPSVGGRDRYYTDDTALIVDPTVDAVTRGVATLAARNLSPEMVRARALALLNEDREKFVRDANRAARDLFGPTTPSIIFDVFKNRRFRPLSKLAFANALRAHHGLEIET